MPELGDVARGAALRRSGELGRVVEHGAIGFVDGCVAVVLCECGDQLVVVRQGEEPGRMVLHSVMALVDGRDGHGDHFALGPGEVAARVHQRGVEVEVGPHGRRVLCVDAQDVVGLSRLAVAVQGQEVFRLTSDTFIRLI